MDIQSGISTKIEFLGENGYPGELSDAKKELDTGKIYTVKHMKVGRSSSTVTLEENGKSYNTVMFKNISDDYTKRDWFSESYRQIR